MFRRGVFGISGDSLCRTVVERGIHGRTRFAAQRARNAGAFIYRRVKEALAVRHETYAALWANIAAGAAAGALVVRQRGDVICHIFL